MSELIASAMFFATAHEDSERYHRATHDVLTGLANRALIYDRLRQGLALAQRRSACPGVLNVDRDGLKAINDRYGHKAGDAAIRETAERIRSASRESDTVARLGGDEFGVILSEVQDLANARRHAERVREEVRQPYSFEEIALEMDASIGIAPFTLDATDIEELLEKADRSMYQVKRGRRHR